MQKEYDIFDCGKILCDDTVTVEDFVSLVFETFDYYEPAGMEIVTIYDPDPAKMHMVTDKRRSLAEENLSQGLLCIGYHIPGKLVYAEGGWGHHMMDIDASKTVESPVQFQLRFADFKGTPVLSDRLTMGQVIGFLRRNEYLEAGSSFRIYRDYFRLDRKPDRVLDITPGAKDLHLTLAELELTGTVCQII